MADLFPPPQGRNAGTGDVPPAPRHDPVQADFGGDTDRSEHLSFPARAEAAIQSLSRWAGPAALVVVLALIAWWLFA